MEPVDITIGLTAQDPFPPGATLSLVQRESGTWETTMDETAYALVAEALGDSDGAPLWVTLFTEHDDRTYTRYVGWITAVSSNNDGPSFYFHPGEKIPAVNIAGLHL